MTTPADRQPWDDMKRLADAGDPEQHKVERYETHGGYSAWKNS